MSETTAIVRVWVFLTSAMFLSNPLSIGLVATYGESPQDNSVIPSSSPNWSQDIRLTFDSQLSIWPSLDTGPQGKVNLAWISSNDIQGGELHFMKVDRTGNILINDTKLTEMSTYSKFPEIAVDSSGKVHMVWIEGEFSQSEISYALMDSNGSLLIGPTQLSYNKKPSFSPFVDTDSLGHVHIVWREGGPSDRKEILYSKLDPSLDDQDGSPADENVISIVNDKQVELDAFSSRIVIDSQDRIHLSYTKKQEVWYEMIDHNGDPLIDGTRLTFATGLSANPSLTFDSSGLLSIAWNDKRLSPYDVIYYTKIDPDRDDQNGDSGMDSNLSIIDDFQISKHDENFSYMPTITCATNGSTNIVWTDAGVPNYVYRSRLDSGGNVDIDSELVNTISGHVAISQSHVVDSAIDLKDRIYITWWDDRDGQDEIYFKYTLYENESEPNQPPVADAGPDQIVHEGDIVQFNGTGSRGSPSNRTIITEDGSEDHGLNPWKPRAASSPDGTLYVVWLGPADADEFHRRIFLSKRDTEGSWEAPVQVTSWSKYENAPSIAVGSLGEIHIAFESFVPELDLGDIYVVSSFDAGLTFRDPVRVDDAPSGMASYYPEIEVASDGKVYVAWYDTRNGGYDVYVASSRDAGRSFSQDRIVNDTTGQHIPPGKRHSGSMHPTLDTGSAGTLYVTWPSGVAWSGIWTDRSTDYGDSWNTDLRIDNSTAKVRGPQRPSLVVDPDGSIHVFWADYRLGHIPPGIWILKPEVYYAYSENDGVSYAPNQKANPEEWRKDRGTSPPSSATDGEGTLFVAYAFLEGWYNHTVRAIVSTDHGSSFQLNASLDTRLRPGEWLARDIVEAYSWRSGCFGMVWLLEHLEPGVKVVVWDSCLSGSGQNVITSYEWDFDASIDLDGDGNYTNDKEATGPTPTHIYYDDGIYVATLTITDSQGLPYTDQCNISVLNVPPTPEWKSRSVDGTFLNPPYPEGKAVLFEASVYDPGIYDTFTYDWDFGDGTILQDAGSSVVHAYGDNDAYIVVLIVTDDDGGVGVDDTPPLPTTNEDPVPKIDLPFCIFVEGLDPCEAIGMFSDPGWLDTHSATWDFGDGTSEPAVLFEKHDPPASTGWNLSSHVYGDDGLYTITFTVTDDDGGTGTATAEVPVQNHPPRFDLYVPITVNEGEQFVLGVEATDPGSDDLTISVDWGDGTHDSRTYYNDGIGPDPPNSGVGVFPFVVQANFTHLYPDDGDYDVTVEVEDDDGGIDIKAFQIPVLNVAPTVTLEVLPIEVNASLRIAGEKWHDVTIEMYEDGELIAGGTLVRYPGSPDDQRLDLSQLQVDYSKKYSATIIYTPDDDPINGQPNGANPCWIILRFSDGEELWFEHTFNVQHPESYVWEVDLTAAVFMHGLTFEATAFDPGADDLTFHWDFGDGTNAISFYPNVNGTYPVQMTDIITHVFLVAGTHNITLTVEDDDSGAATVQVIITI